LGSSPPFIGLKDEDRRQLLTWAKEERKPTPVLEDIARHFVGNLDDKLTALEKYDYMLEI
jgi:hypothetical protein